ncbi:SMI1/KNR4 family protein [Streptomyces sp. Tu 3180]|uniref:SMI1/KNR4 family protein n=1 Tax=Streptomyces sp. Tu 3180 TaxID=2682611 RepID=UPI001FB5C46D|nr:SMI1/KNR4 family protein [Streptomyces sp. Tu 3180]
MHRPHLKAGYRSVAALCLVLTGVLVAGCGADAGPTPEHGVRRDAKVIRQYFPEPGDFEEVVWTAELLEVWGPLVVTTLAEIQALLGEPRFNWSDPAPWTGLEQELGIEFPADFREIVDAYGSVVING